MIIAGIDTRMGDDGGWTYCESCEKDYSDDKIKEFMPNGNFKCPYCKQDIHGEGKNEKQLKRSKRMVKGIKAKRKH